MSRHNKIQDEVDIIFERPKNISDLIKIQAIASWCRERNEEELGTSISNSDLFVSAYYEGKLVGSAMVLTDYMYYAVVFDVIVDERFHSKGIGTKIMRALQTHPSLQKVKRMYLFTRDKQKFYEKLGWQIYPGNALYLER